MYTRHLNKRLLIYQLTYSKISSNDYFGKTHLIIN